MECAVIVGTLCAPSRLRCAPHAKSIQVAPPGCFMHDKHGALGGIQARPKDNSLRRG
jgi:hypothetical protein